MPTRLNKNEERALSRRIGFGLRAARNRAGLTQKEAGRQTGLSTEVYGRYERGLTLPSVPMLAALCLALKATPDELLGMVPREEKPISDEQAALASLIPRTRHGARLLRAMGHLKPSQFRLVARLVDDLVGRK